MSNWQAWSKTERTYFTMAQRTQLDNCNHPLHDAYACLLANGLDGAGEALRILVNEASRIERVQHLQATPYERSAQPRSSGSGVVNRPGYELTPRSWTNFKGASSIRWRYIIAKNWSMTFAMT